MAIPLKSLAGTVADSRVRKCLTRRLSAIVNYPGVHMRSIPVVFLLLVLSIGCMTGAKFMFREVETLADRGSPAAQYHLGMLYNNGIGTQEDRAEAFKWFERSASAGDPLGHFKLGCYYGGQGKGVVAIDHKKALEHKLVAARQGYSWAQYGVARIYYENGNKAEAVKWLKQAADQGLPESIYYLYELYSEGRGFPIDNVMAYGSLKIFETRYSCKANRVEIEEKLRVLENELSVAQLKQAQEYASNWRAQKTDLTIRAENGMVEIFRLIEKAREE